VIKPLSIIIMFYDALIAALFESRPICRSPLLDPLFLTTLVTDDLGACRCSPVIKAGARLLGGDTRCAVGRRRQNFIDELLVRGDIQCAIIVLCSDPVLPAFISLNVALALTALR